MAAGHWFFLGRADSAELSDTCCPPQGGRAGSAAAPPQQQQQPRREQQTEQNQKRLHLAAQSTMGAVGVSGLAAAVGLGVAQHQKRKKCLEHHGKDCTKGFSIFGRSLDGQEKMIGIRKANKLRTRDDGHAPGKADPDKLQKRSVDPDFDENIKKPLKDDESPRNSRDQSVRRTQTAPERASEEQVRKEQQDRDHQKTQHDRESRAAQAGPGRQKSSPSSGGSGTAREGSMQATPRERQVTMPAANSGGSAEHAAALAGASNPRQISGRPSTAYEGDYFGRPRSRGPSPAYQTGRALSPIFTEQEARSPRSGSSSTGSTTTGSGSSRPSEASWYDSWATNQSGSTRSVYSNAPSKSGGSTDSARSSSKSAGSASSHGSSSASRTPRPRGATGHRSLHIARGERSSVARSSSTSSAHTADETTARRRRLWRGGLVAGGVGVVATVATASAVKGIRKTRCRTDPIYCTPSDPGGRGRTPGKSEHPDATRQAQVQMQAPADQNQASKQASKPAAAQPSSPPGSSPGHPAGRDPGHQAHP